MQIHRAMLFVSDLAGMTAFYRDVLGLTPAAGGGDGTCTEFDAGACRFALHAIPPHLAGSATAVPPAPREANPWRIDFMVADVAAERRRLEALGVRLLVRPWGACDVVDPEGNVIRLVDQAA